LTYSPTWRCGDSWHFNETRHKWSYRPSMSV